MRNSSYSSPPGPNKHLAAHSSAWPSTKTPVAAPEPGLVLLSPCPCTVPGPGDLIVLKHSSYLQIFQCPLSLVSDLHICWNTVGCSLCSSDQLGISLALRGSGLRSHLSHRHLIQPTNFSSFITAFQLFFLHQPGTFICIVPTPESWHLAIPTVSLGHWCLQTALDPLSSHSHI